MTGRFITDHSSPPDDIGGANGATVEAAPGTTGLFGSFPRVRSSNVSGLGVFAAIGSAVLCLAFSLKVSSGTFTPKFAVVLIFAAVGIVPLARLVKLVLRCVGRQEPL